MSTEIFQSIILGIVQGLGEFLPISSTAHLVLAPYFFHWEDPGLAFDVALHAGTLIAVVGYFWRDWLNILKAVFKNESQMSNLAYRQAGVKGQMYKRNIFWFLIVATIPGVLAGYFLEEKAETVLRSPLLIAFTLVFFGFLLYLADKYFSKKKDLKNITIVDSIIIGICQAIAIVPGVSRSGATITAGLGLGMNRVDAAKFSFLLSTPIIFGATVLKINYIVSDFSLVMAIGILASAISGFLAIKYLIKFVEKSSYAVFFWYRLILAAIILIVYYS